MMGLPNCSSFMPTARHNARAPAIRRPSVLNELLSGFFITSIEYMLLSLYGVAPFRLLTYIILLSNKKALLVQEKGPK